MLRAITAASLAVLALTIAPRARAADDFGSPGVIVSGERLMPLVSYQTSTTTDSNKNATTDSRTSFSLVTSSPTITTLYNYPRLALDIVVVPNLTLGGSAWIYTDLNVSRTTAPANGASMSTDQPKATYWGFAPRVGYVFSIGNLLAIWPRAGIEYMNVGTSSTSQTVAGVTVSTGAASVWQLAANVEAMLVVTPFKHFGIALGPTADIPISGKESQTTTAVVGGTTTTSTTNSDLSTLQVGLDVGLLGYF
jgi:hypothetical protein